MVLPTGRRHRCWIWLLTVSVLLSSARPVEAQPLALTRPPVLLYHKQPDERIATIRAIAETHDPQWVDDLIRGYSVETYTPVKLVYAQALQRMTGQRVASTPSAWKAWLAAEVEARRLKRDYAPLELDSLDQQQRAQIQPLALQSGQEQFQQMASVLREPGCDRAPIGDALRYMVFNDHRPEVQTLLTSDWLSRLLACRQVNLNTIAYTLNGLADPGPIRASVNAQVCRCLDADDPVVSRNALHMLAGVEGYSTVLSVPEATERVRELLGSPNVDVVRLAERAMDRLDPRWRAANVTYEEAFTDLYATLGREYPCFELKGIDWQAVGAELLPRAAKVASDDEFGLLCLELVARLEDSHAMLSPLTAELPQIAFPRWDPGLACLIDDRGQPVVYYVDRGGPAESAGVRAGMTVARVNGQPAQEVLGQCMSDSKRYVGYSSERYLRFQAARWLLRQMDRGTLVSLELESPDGERLAVELPAECDVRYLPRLPVPIAGIRDSANVSWTKLDGNLGYIYVRRIRRDLIEQLDRAVAELQDARGIVIDVRGNSGGGFDGRRAHRNFAPDDPDEPDRPRFAGPMALLLDSRCISAGEGWASWFVASGRATSFGEATAGASSRKRVYELTNAKYRVVFPIKAYRGYLDRPIERRGLEPDVPVVQNARDLANQRDTVLEAARQYLLAQPQP